ncbi:Histone-Lysine N-Methyltransferase Ash1L [Manis pentadactyla]|nr:Histone-Lysine N-Methyltransferase Ash1L [Manis pentadactyla]
MELQKGPRHRGSSKKVRVPQHCTAAAAFVPRWSCLETCLSRVDLPVGAHTERKCVIEETYLRRDESGQHLRREDTWVPDQIIQK